MDFGYDKATLQQRGIYAICNRACRRVYVGQTRYGFRHRWGMHVGDLDRGTHSNVRLQSDWRLHGIQAFSFRILEVIPRSIHPHYFLFREWRYISSLDNPYNDVLELKTGILAHFIQKGVFVGHELVDIPGDLFDYIPDETA